MPASMSIAVPLTGFAKIRRAKVSLPMISALVDDPRYRPNASPPPARQERRPSLRFLVKTAVRAQSAEELGLLLRQRFERRAAGEAEDEKLDAQLAEIERRLLGS